MDVQVVTGSPGELAQWFVNDLERAVRATPSSRRCTLAVPGGSVAEAFFPLLATAEIAWRSVEIFWVDERAVAPTDPQSNYALAARLWLVPAGVPADNVHRMPAERADLPGAAQEYTRDLAAAAGTPPQLDYVLLGVGEDGHVASIFPAGVVETEAVVAWIDDAPKPPARRMTLGMRTLAGARRVVVAAFGPAKRPAVQAALAGGPDESPLARLLRGAEKPVLLVESGLLP